MGIFPKTETRCHNFSFFGRQDFQKRDFRKTRNFGTAFQLEEADWVTKSPVRHKLYRVLLTKCPYPIGAPRALRRSLSVGLRYRFHVPSWTDGAPTRRR